MLGSPEADLLAALVAIGSVQVIAMAKLVRDVSTLKTQVDPMWQSYQASRRVKRPDGGENRCPDLDPGEKRE